MIIELPDGREIEAPDGLPPERVKSIVQKFYAPKTEQPRGGLGAVRFLGPLPYLVDKALATPGAGESAARGGLQGLSLGWGDEGAAAIAAALPFTDREAVGGGDTFGERYNSARGFYRGKNSAAKEKNPGVYMGGEIAGGIVPTLALPASKAGQALSLGKRMVQGAKVGSLLGGASGAGMSEAGDAGGLATDTAGGSVLGGLAGAAVPAVMSAGKRLLSSVPSVSAPVPSASAQGGGAAAGSQSSILIRPQRLKMPVFGTPDPTQDAQFLLGRGVRLTRGMYDPQSSLNMVELASTSRPGTGPLILKQRAQALQDALDLGFKEAIPPGATVKLSGDMNAKYAALKGAWDDAYEAIRATGEKIYPAVHDGQGGKALLSTAKRPGLIDQIVNDQDEIWDDASRAQAKRFLDNQLTRLSEVKGALGRVDLGDMLKVLSKVKEAGRSAQRSQKFDLADILGRAQDAIEQAVESQASPETSAALKALNSKYRDFKVIEDAVIRAGDSPAGITPARFSAAVKGAEPLRSRYAAGGGGPLRQLSQAIGTVFDESTVPRTGARLLAAAPDWAQTGLIGPTIYLRNAAAARASGGAASAAAPAASRASRAIVPAKAFDAASEPGSRLAALIAALRQRGVPGLVSAGAEEDQ